MLWFEAAGLEQIGRAGSYGCQRLHLGKGGADYLIAEACRLALDDFVDFVDTDNEIPRFLSEWRNRWVNRPYSA
jgi:hypothetical protein